MARCSLFSGPTSSVITYHFFAHERQPETMWTWYDGGLQPPLPPDWEPGRKLMNSGTLIIGRKATVIAQSLWQSVRIVPETMRET